MLDALVDGELDGATVREIEAHLALCPDCASRRSARIALQARVRSDAPNFDAPASLRSAVAHSLSAVADSRKAPAGRPT
ncbi:MAG: zf-HC2 domain-containing protein, partial [Candidatus Parcubacteria bacterium]|nr:zf-HC2 domain-containing protein [Burkholderiales bacterium]